jgi:hypothetical protein
MEQEVKLLAWFSLIAGIALLALTGIVIWLGTTIDGQRDQIRDLTTDVRALCAERGGASSAFAGPPQYTVETETTGCTVWQR